MWMKSVKAQEHLIAQAQQNTDVVEPNDMSSSNTVANTEIGCKDAQMYSSVEDNTCPPTYNENVPAATDALSTEELINKISEDRDLNEEQWVTFCIIMRSFITSYIHNCESESEPL